MADSATALTSGPLANSKGVAITRKVSRLLDVASNEHLWQVLEYVSEKNFVPAVTHPSSETGTTQPSPIITQPSQAPRPLKNAMEDRVLALHAAYLTEFQKVRDSYREVAKHVKQLDDCSAKLAATLSEHRQHAEVVLQSIGVLRAEQDEVRQNAAQVQRFMDQYSLTNEEINLLKSGEMQGAFLETLNKVKSIHRSCKELLAANHHQAAVEIMESMYLIQVAAVERLTKHLLNQCSEIMAHDIPDVTDVFVGLVRTVYDRPAQWAKVMHEMARVRKTSVLRRYYELMTKGSARVGRPLESMSHDPIRFFGDLFAWLHQCLAEESDLFDNFFHSASGHGAHQPSSAGTSPTEPSASGTFAAQLNVPLSKEELLDIVFEGLCKHIRTKLEGAFDQHRKVLNGSTQALHAAVVGAFQLDGILLYFVTKTSPLLGSSASLTKLLANAKLDNLKNFYDLLKAATLRLTQLRIRDVSVPGEIGDVLRILKQMMDSMDASLVPYGEREKEFAPVLGAITDPLLALVQQPNNPSLEGLSDETRRCVLRINVLSALHLAVVGFSFAAARQQKIKGLLETEIASLTTASANRMLSNFGFDGNSLSPDAAWGAMQQLYSYTATSGTLPMPHLDGIQSIRTREAMQAAAIEQVCTAYESWFRSTAPIPSVDPSAIEPRKLRVMLDADASAAKRGSGA